MQLRRYRKVPNGSSFEVDIAPGEYRMHAVDGAMQADTTMDLSAGHTYYLRLALAGSSGKVLTGGQVGLQLIQIPEAQAKMEMVKLKTLSADKITPPAIEALVGAAARRVAFAHELEDNGLRAGHDMSVVASGPQKTYLTIYMAVSKPILFQIGEDQASLDKIKAAGFVQFTVADPSLRGYSPLGSAIGEALTGEHNEPGCNVPDECTRTWNF